MKSLIVTIPFIILIYYATMDQSNIILDVINKHASNIQLTTFEKAIFSFCTSKISYFNVDKIIPDFTQALNEYKTQVVKLIFANDQHIYVEKHLLLTIEYFKNMFETCDTNNGDQYYEINVDPHIDHYELMTIIFMFVELKKYDILNFKTLLDILKIIQFLGNIMHKNTNMLHHIIDNLELGLEHFNIPDDELQIDMYTLENIYLTISTYKTLENKIKWIIVKLFKNIILDENVFKLSFFTNIMMTTNIGIKYIIKQNYKPLIDILIDNHTTTLLDVLLCNDSIESWNLIMSLENHELWEKINSYLLQNSRMISETVLNVDITKFSKYLYIRIITKFKKCDLIDKYFENKIVSFNEYNAVEGNNYKYIRNNRVFENDQIIIKSSNPLEFQSIFPIGNIIEIVNLNNEINFTIRLHNPIVINLDELNKVKIGYIVDNIMYPINIINNYHNYHILNLTISKPIHEFTQETILYH